MSTSLDIVRTNENLVFFKCQHPHVHAHHSHHAYSLFARHDHTHTHMHLKVYKCTHCGRKGHLAKFCYDRIHHVNFANNKYVWVPYKTNPKGPKRKWVPKFPPFVFDVGEGSHTTWEEWCLDGGCMDLKDIYLMHRYQGGLVGQPPCLEFWNIVP